MYDLIAQLFVFIFALVYAVILVGLISLWVRKGRGTSKRVRAQLSVPRQNPASGPSTSSALESLGQDRK